jgi:hypothetical protein
MVVSIKETMSCRYIIIVKTAKICKAHEVFMPRVPASLQAGAIDCTASSPSHFTSSISDESSSGTDTETEATEESLEEEMSLRQVLEGRDGKDVGSSKASDTTHTDTAVKKKAGWSILGGGNNLNNNDNGNGVEIIMMDSADGVFDIQEIMKKVSEKMKKKTIGDADGDVNAGGVVAEGQDPDGRMNEQRAKALQKALETLLGGKGDGDGGVDAVGQQQIKVVGTENVNVDLGSVTGGAVVKSPDDDDDEDEDEDDSTMKQQPVKSSDKKKTQDGKNVGGGRESKMAVNDEAFKKIVLERMRNMLLKKKKKVPFKKTDGSRAAEDLSKEEDQ